MKTSSDLKATLWGAAAGGAVLATVGFMWGGWVTQRTADADARQRASREVALALGQVCADRFRQQSDIGERLAQLRGIGSWQRPAFIQNGGWATMAGRDTSDAAVAAECAALLSADR
jgi:hypothetical protein